MLVGNLALAFGQQTSPKPSLIMLNHLPVLAIQVSTLLLALQALRIDNPGFLPQPINLPTIAVGFDVEESIL